MVPGGEHLRKVLWNLVAFTSPKITVLPLDQKCPPIQIIPLRLSSEVSSLGKHSLTSPHQPTPWATPFCTQSPSETPLHLFRGVEIIALSFLSTQVGYVIVWSDWGWVSQDKEDEERTQGFWKDRQLSASAYLLSASYPFSLCYWEAKSDFIWSIVPSSSNTMFFSLICRSSEWDVSGVVWDFGKSY